MEKITAVDNNAATGAGKRQRVVRFLTHLICIGMLFILPEILSSLGRPFQAVPELRLGVYAKSLVFILVFYVNYFFIIGRSFDRKRGVLRLVCYNLVVIAASLILFRLISVWMEPYWHEAWRIRQAAKGITVSAPHHRPDHNLIYWLNFFARDFAMLVLTIGLSIALKISDNWLRLSRRADRMEADRRQQELTSLKSQLNPHFLFNTLNSIYALIDISPDKARDAVHELSGMLRYVLYDERGKVELEKELKFVRNYVNLMSLRLPENVRVELIGDTAGYDRAMVPPLMLIPLVENLFKHYKTGGEGSVLEISVEAADGRVTCVTSNECDEEKTPAVDKKVSTTDEKISRSADGGIGLQNLRRRLQLIFGDKGSLETERRDGRFVARISFPADKSAV